MKEGINKNSLKKKTVELPQSAHVKSDTSEKS
jgi:hypothetical protein